MRSQIVPYFQLNYVEAHVNTTGETGTFKIISNHSVSSGVKRIEGITERLQKPFYLNKPHIRTN